MWKEEVRLLVKPNSGSKQYLKASSLASAPPFPPPSPPAPHPVAVLACMALIHSQEQLSH